MRWMRIPSEAFREAETCTLSVRGTRVEEHREPATKPSPVSWRASTRETALPA